MRVPVGVRPTGGRVREALCSIWADRLPGCWFLDLFAGSGSVGLEAISRGAEHATFVEREGPHVEALEANCRSVGGGHWTIVTYQLKGASRAGSGHSDGLGLAKALKMQSSTGLFDLIFADPPYRFDGWDSLLAEVDPVLASTGELAVEHSARSILPDLVGRLLKFDRRLYGESALSFYRVTPEE